MKYQRKMNARKFLSKVSVMCGVYVMKAEDGKCLYIGKAKNLRNRLGSHLRPSGLSHRFEAIMNQVSEIETIVTRTESEALLLENNLIKSHKPRYNIDLRDDKSYPYIRLDDSHEFPKLSFYRGNRKEPGTYFGPFSSAAGVRETLSQLQKIFPVRQCRDSFYEHRSRPCLQYQINRCTGPCVGMVDRVTYMEDVKQVTNYLLGKNQSLNKMLVARMEQATEVLDFETAAKYRDRITAIQRLRETQSVDGRARQDIDVICVVIDQGIICIQMMLVRRGRNIDHRTYYPKSASKVDANEILVEFIPRHYLGRDLPGLILVDRKFEGMDLMMQVFSDQADKRVTIRKPQRGSKLKLMEMARVNALDAIRRRISDKFTMNERMTSLLEVLEIDNDQIRIECFDISHTAGEKAVASCVVFDENGPVKDEYRRMNISGIAPGDDYAAMEQAFMRRYKKMKETERGLPDLILIDGGQGQLKVAMTVLQELQIDGIQLMAISKGRERKPGKEQMWLPQFDSSIEVGQNARLMLQKIRDEAHRFALLGHRQRRKKVREQSVLEDIPGIGRRRRSMLLKHFGGLQGVNRAGVNELVSVPGISPKLANAIYNAIHSQE